MTTSSDKTKDKLLNSMRMSKQGSADTAAEKEAAPAAGKPAPAPKKTVKKKATSAKKAAATKPAAKKAAMAAFSSSEGRATIDADSFESGKRIWPD